MFHKIKNSTTKDQRYLMAKDKFLEYSYEALGNHFSSRDEFNAFFNRISTDTRKSLFLRTASFYLFLVKNGDWHIKVQGSDSVVEYLTNTYKYISIFSLIESLSDDKYIDFYQFITMRRTKERFLIEDRKALEVLYRSYKTKYGSTTKCISFFKKLSPGRQRDLVNKLQVHGHGPTASIEKLAKYLYDLRSRFVHEAEFVHHMSMGTSVSYKDGRMIVCTLSIADAMKFFEEGLIAYFHD